MSERAVYVPSGRTVRLFAPETGKDMLTLHAATPDRRPLGNLAPGRNALYARSPGHLARYESATATLRALETSATASDTSPSNRVAACLALATRLDAAERPTEAARHYALALTEAGPAAAARSTNAVAGLLRRLSDADLSPDALERLQHALTERAKREPPPDVSQTLLLLARIARSRDPAAAIDALLALADKPGLVSFDESGVILRVAPFALAQSELRRWFAGPEPAPPDRLEERARAARQALADPNDYRALDRIYRLAPNTPSGSAAGADAAKAAWTAGKDEFAETVLADMLAAPYPATVRAATVAAAAWHKARGWTDAGTAARVTPDTARWIHAWNLASGRLMPAFRLSPGEQGAHLPFLNSHMVVMHVGGGPREFSGFEMAGGREIFRTKTEINLMPHSDYGNHPRLGAIVFLGNSSGFVGESSSVLALGLISGAVLWRYQPRTETEHIEFVRRNFTMELYMDKYRTLRQHRRRTNSDAATPASLRLAAILHGPRSAGLHHAATGDLLWEIETPDWNIDAVMPDPRGTVILAAGGHDVMVRDTLSGWPLFRKTTTARRADVQSASVTESGFLCMEWGNTDADIAVGMYALPDWRPLWRTPVPPNNPPSLQAYDVNILPGGLGAVTTAGGIERIFDTTSGNTLWSPPDEETARMSLLYADPNRKRVILEKAISEPNNFRRRIRIAAWDGSVPVREFQYPWQTASPSNLQPSILGNGRFVTWMIDGGKIPMTIPAQPATKKRAATPERVVHQIGSSIRLLDLDENTPPDAAPALMSNLTNGVFVGAMDVQEYAGHLVVATRNGVSVLRPDAAQNTKQPRDESLGADGRQP